MARAQLLELGFDGNWIEWRIASGRLHRIHRGVYAVGRPDVSRHGRWMAAVLACGSAAVLSHGSGAALWEIAGERGGLIEISVPEETSRARRGIRVHRRSVLESSDLTTHNGIAVTTPIATLVDLASYLGPRQLEAAVNQADKERLVDPEKLRRALAGMKHRPGLPALCRLLDQRTFRLSDSELERAFLPLVRAAGLPLPRTRQWVNGFRVDFYWPELGLVVETDGLRYHRTPAQQAHDRLRDQAHIAAGLTPLRFTHQQIHYDPRHVQKTLIVVAERLRAA